ncbi:MAG: ABC-F family ATP-binding cassette domain-containing protein [Euryarchaeota archaeon]|nr:ABC-F family ATP-binding cassette domain-containing protein [Euryarchaeota archaeon]
MITIRGLGVTLNGRDVLRNVNLDLPDGGLVLIYGPSGGGKTTLLRALVGVIPEIIKGSVVGSIIPSPLDIRRRCVYVPQEPWFSVATPYVWSEVSSLTGLSVDDIIGILNRFKLGHTFNRTTHTLSAGELHRISLIAAIKSKCDYVFLDEPSSYLDAYNISLIVDHVKELVDSGKLVVIVDHNVYLWKKLASLFIRISRESYLGLHEVTEEVSRKLKKPKATGDLLGSILIREFKYPGQKTLMRNISFRVNRGDIIHVKGPSGSGKTTLLRLVARRVISSSVDVRVRGKICYIPDNPLLYFSEPKPSKEVLNNLEILRDLNLLHIKDAPIMRISSGERRRLAIASAVVRRYDIILLDEPTVGLDIENKVRVLNTIVSTADRGVSFIIASHDPLVEKISTKSIYLGDEP